MRAQGQADRAPVATEAEEGFVASMLSFPDRICPILAGSPLPESAWMSEDCRKIVGAAMRRWRERLPIDPILVGADLKAEISASRITQLATMDAIPSAAADYLALIREAFARREVISACLRAQKVANEDSSLEALAVLSAVAASLNRPDSSRVSVLRDVLKNTITELSADPPRRLKTGWQCLDDISPVQAGDVVVIAAPAKGGKTTLALSYASEVAKRGGNVLFLSLEMTANLLSIKLLSRDSGVPLAKFFARDFSDSDTQRIGASVRRLSTWSVEIRDDVQTLDQVVGACRLANAKAPLDMVVVDYLQLIQGPREKNETREREVAQISRTLRLLAMELGCVIVPLSQLNEEGRLRESRAIGQDATAVWKLQDADDPGRRVVQVIQRNGESPASCELRFRGYVSSFDDGQ
jgi:replicative DNA helicase